MATTVLEEMERGDIPVLIGRAPEFYGPGRTQSFTNRLIFDRIKAGKTPQLPVRSDKRRSLIWTPDASRALALLGTTDDAFGQTWHLPTDTNRPTYREFATLANNAFGVEDRASVVPEWVLWGSGTLNSEAREIRELLPRYRHDNLFDSSKFRARFPDFAITSYEQGVAEIHAESIESSRS